MCGIFGILNSHGARFDRQLLRRMGQVQRHRGPDDYGELVDGDLMFGMQRLSIIDVAGGHQPIANEDGTVSVICNGEIYNFRELRRELIARGHEFSTRSDSEVIVHLYEEHGAGFVKHLHGMFALALWDHEARRLLLARDRLGIKPLYIRRDSRYLAFSSELKSLLEIPGARREVDPAALHEYLALGYVPTPLCLLQGYEKLQPGTLLVASSAGVSMEPYWQPDHEQPEDRTLEEWSEDLVPALEQAVVSQMVSDVPLGAFLSGGIDSSAVVAFMARNSSRPVNTYSIGFETNGGAGYYNELPYAKQVARRFATNHHEIIVRPDVARLLPDLLWHMDEPVADSALVTTYLVSEFARQDVKVILSGVGGDELFGGYRRYWSEYLAHKYRRLPRLLRESLLVPLAGALPSDRHSKWLDRSRLVKSFLRHAELDADARYERFMRVFSPDHLSRICPGAQVHESAAVTRAFTGTATDDAVQRLIEVDLQTQLPDDLLLLTDRMSMATSLECRVPLLDDRLLDLSRRMPGAMKVRGTKLKLVLKQALRGVLPDQIIDRKKRGFGAPVGNWFKNELTDFVDSVLDEKTIRKRALFDWDGIRELRAAHAADREDYTDHLLSLVNFEIWCQVYLDETERGAVAEDLLRARAS